MVDENLTIQERIARRRAAKAAEQNGNSTPEPTVATKRTARTVEPVAQDAPVAEPVVVRTEPAAPVEPPANAVPVDAVPEPRVRRRVVDAGTGAVVTPPVKKVDDLIVEQPVPEQPIVNVVETRAERVKEQAMNASQALIIGLLEHMRAGEQLLITRDNDNLWSIVLPTSVTGSYVVKTTSAGTQKIEPKAERRVRTSGKLPANFNDSLLNPEYTKWQNDWRAMTLDQKEAFAKKAGVTQFPDKSMDEKMYNMRLAMAVNAVTGLSKYKPQYATQAARDAAKQKALQGLDW